MRIGFDAKRAFANTTGLGNYSRGVIECVSRLRPDWECVLYGPPRKDNLLDPEVLNRVNVRVATPSPPLAGLKTTLWRAFALSKIIKKDRVNIQHGLSHELPLGIRSSGAKSIVTIHDMLPFRHPELFPRLDNAVYKRKFRHACRAADLVVAVSDMTRRDIMRYLGTAPEKIRVVYQRCDPAFYEPLSPRAMEELKQRFDLPERFILTVGSVIERKNLLGLVRALELLEGYARVPLLVGGNGKAYLERVREYIRDKGLGAQVRFLGHVPFADLPGLYQAATVFAYPSFFEGFGIPITEALFSRTPVVTSTGSCFPESGGPDSLYADPADPADIARALETVLSDPGLAETMAHRGYEYAQRFHDHAVARELLAAYESLAE